MCGRVRYAVDREPDDVINCSCTFCQRATGSAYLVETMFPKESLTVIDGEPKTYDHVSDGSGKIIHIHFCENCGTKLYMTFDRFPASAGVFSGTFDDTNWFPRNVENCLYFFLREAQDGTVIPADAEVYNAHYWEREGVPSTPQVFADPTIVTAEVRAASRKFAKGIGERE